MAPFLETSLDPSEPDPTLDDRARVPKLARRVREPEDRSEPSVSDVDPFGATKERFSDRGLDLGPKLFALGDRVGCARSSASRRIAPKVRGSLAHSLVSLCLFRTRPSLR